MIIRALVVDDDPASVRTVGDILESHGHAHDSAGDVETTRKLLVSGSYDYLVLDMNIPVAPRRLSRRENGRNLLAEIRAIPACKELPVIVITGEVNGDGDFIVSVMKAGGSNTDFVQKPFDGEKLDRAIREAIERRGKQAPGDAAVEVGRRSPAPFRAERREMVIYDGRVTLCGVEVWKDCAQPDLREALIRLAARDRHGYVRVRGADLTEDLGRDASNPIGKPLERFCKHAGEVMLAERGLECGRYDIVAGGRGGYHFTEWMDVRVADGRSQAGATPDATVANADATDDATAAAAGAAVAGADATGAPADATLNDRQRWILERLDSGVMLRNKDISSHFGKDRSTIHRDIKLLRERGLLATHPDGYYVRAQRRAS